MLSTNHFDKHAIQTSFAKAAKHYDKYAKLQYEIGLRLLEHLDFIKIAPKHILDLGAGTGVHSKLISKRYRKSRVTLLDIASDMLHIAKKNAGWFSKNEYLCADADSKALPILPHSMDMVFSNMMVHWSTDFPALFTKIHEILHHQGIFLFSTLGPDSLKEIRDSWAQVDDVPHVHTFIDIQEAGDALMKAKFAEPVLDREIITLHYQNAYDVMRDLKGIGAHNLLQDRQKSLTGKKRLKKFVEAYEQFRVNGQLPLTYEVIYGVAWGSQPNNVIPISSIKKHV